MKTLWEGMVNKGSHFADFVRFELIKIFTILNKGKNKTIYVYFMKQKLLGYSPSSVLLN